MVVLSGLITSSLFSAPVPGGSQRYVGLMLLNLSQTGAEERRLIEEAHKYGMNSVYLTIHWDMVYYDSPTATPDWARFDDQIQLAVSKGMSVAIRVHVSRSKLRLNGFWSWADDGLKDHLEISHMGAYHASTFRYHYMPAARKAAGFVHELVTRYQWVHNQGKLLFVSVSNTPEQEAGYPYENFEPETDHPEIYPTNFDCSQQSMSEFRSWLQQRYGKIYRLNKAWGTNFNSFSDAHPRIAFWDPRETFQTRRGKDWYRYSHDNLKKYTELLIDTVKSVSPDIRFISDYGSVHDRGANVRGTVLFGDINAKGDGVKVNDSPHFDNRFTMDVVRGALRTGAFVGNEVFVQENTPFSDIEKQVEGNFRHGAHFVGFVVSTLSSFTRVESLVRSAISNWQNVPRPLYLDEPGPVIYNSSAAIDQGIDSQVYNAWATIALSNPGTSRPTKVLPDNDILTQEFWNLASNILPRLVTPLPQQEGKAGEAFDYTISTSHFADEDGWIARFEASGLPSGLSFDDRRIYGTPSAPGSAQVTITAVDDEGGTVPATLNLVIRDPGSLDVKYHQKFQAQLVEQIVSLTWGTEQEVNASHFEVERSASGLVFETIGRVEARRNAETRYSYRWNDESPLSGLNYYRLKAIDLDGTFSYTEIVSLNVFFPSGQGVIFPNPASDYFYIPDEKPAYLELHNVYGQKVSEVFSDRMFVKNMPAGLYLVKVSDEKGKKKTYRLFIK